MASYSSPNSLVQPPPPRGASSLRRRSPYARMTDTPLDAAIRHFCAAVVPEPRARRGRATGGAARRSAVAIAMAGEATGGACWASTGPCAAGVAPCCGWRRKRHDALFAFVDWARRTCEASIDGLHYYLNSSRLARASYPRGPTRVRRACRRSTAAAAPPRAIVRVETNDSLRARSKTRFEGFRVKGRRVATRRATSSNLSRAPPSRAAAVSSPHISCDLRTHCATLFLKPAGSSRNCFAASMFAGLSSLGEESMEMMDSMMVSTVCTGLHRSLACS